MAAMFSIAGMLFTTKSMAIHWVPACNPRTKKMEDQEFKALQAVEQVQGWPRLRETPSQQQQTCKN